MTDRETPDETTPRPWVAQSRDDGKSDPWWIDTHAYPDGPEPVWAPPQYPVSEADAALIVAAVNDYDRLRAIEIAARAVLAFLPNGPNGAMPTGPFINSAAALRKALERPR